MRTVTTGVRRGAALASGALLVVAVACGGGDRPASSSATNPPASAGAATQASANSSTAPSAPIDVCGIITPAVAETVLGKLPAQPPSKTDNAGFGVRMCMYLGPAISGQGAQTVFVRLTVQTAASKDAADMLQGDADMRKATADLSGVGDRAKRNATGSFVWAQKGGVACTAELSNGLPPGVTADSAPTKLGELCNKIFASAK